MEPQEKAWRKTFLTPSLIIVLIVNLLFRFIAFGYFIVSFVLKYHENLFTTSTLHVLNQIRVWVLPLGTTMEYLTFSLASFLFIQSVTAIIGILGISCKKKILLILFAGINLAMMIVEIINLAFFATILKEIPGTKDNFHIYEQTISQDAWSSTLDCFRDETPTVLPSGATIATCYDTFKGILENYVETFIIMIAFNIILSVACIVIADLSYRTIGVNSEVPAKGKTSQDMKYGILRDGFNHLTSHWKRDRLIFLSTFLVIFSGIVNISFWLTLIISYVGQYRENNMWTILDRTEYRGIYLGPMVAGLTVATLVIIPLWEFIKVLYFIGAYWQHITSLGWFISVQLFLVISDIIAIGFMSLLIDIYMCCNNTTYPQCAGNGEICKYNGSLGRYSGIFIGFTTFRLFLQIIGIGFEDRIFKHISKTNLTVKTKRKNDSSSEGTRQHTSPHPDGTTEDHAGYILYSLRALRQYFSRNDKPKVPESMKNMFSIGTFCMMIMDIICLITIILMTFEPGIIKTSLQDSFTNITSFSGNVYTVYEGLSISYIVIVVLHLTLLVFGAFSWRGMRKGSLQIYKFGCFLYSFLGFILFGFSCYFVALDNCCIRPSDCAFQPQTTIQQMCDDVVLRVLLGGLVWTNFVFTFCHWIFNALLGIVVGRTVTIALKKIEPENEAEQNEEEGTDSKVTEIPPVRPDEDRGESQSSARSPSLGNKDASSFDLTFTPDPINTISERRKKKKKKKKKMKTSIL